MKRKPGRPKLPKGEAKGKIVPIRFTKAEAEQLDKVAKTNGLTLSEWIRRTVLAAQNATSGYDDRIRVPPGLRCDANLGGRVSFSHRMKCDRSCI